MGPEHCFATFLFWHDFGLWKVKCGDFVATSVLDIPLYVCGFDVCFDVEAGEVLDHELA